MVNTEPNTNAYSKSATNIEEMVMDQLMTCYDPEVPVNIVDLGLIYRCHVKPADSGGYNVDIQMTLTSPGCQLGAVLVNDVEAKIKKIAGVKNVYVDLVFEPPWDSNRMTEAAKLELDMM